MFTEGQLLQIRDHGISLPDIEKQIENFRKGFAFTNLIKPAIVNDGILRFNNEDVNGLADFYDRNQNGKKLIKFIPASGAASRMFKELFSFLETYSASQDDIIKFEKDRGFNSVYNLIDRLTEFAFYPELVEILKKNGISIEDSLQKKEYHIIIGYLLAGHGLNYGQLPKGLLKFHKYPETNRTPAEEHLVEAALYGKSVTGKAQVHFTISPEHAGLFNDHINKVIEKYKEKFNLEYEIGFSEQKKSTDTIAVDLNNNPFLDKNSRLVFRPGGHGALIENLNDLDGDIVFIKNIDNVVPDSLKPETTLYKKALAGLLLRKQEKVFGYLNVLEGETFDEAKINEIVDFFQNELNIIIPDTFFHLYLNDKKDYLFQHLNRPMRVCGMVKNEGEPGGGPFWVKNTKGEISLQIIESSQIDPDNPKQKTIAQNATHFNPVDLICGIKDFRGEKFDLLDFVDPETGFISLKSKDGRELKAQELPGLWNGAMANWITVFVEVPVITFNPVKTVNDLLRETHS